MKRLEFWVAGTPKAQPRVKACRRGAHAGVFDPGTANDWKSIVRLEAKSNWDGVQFDGPVHLGLSFILQRPQSHFGKKGLKASAPMWVNKKPDVDNLTKAVCDALTNVGMWRDDAQICAHTVTKQYGPNPGCRVVIREIEEPGALV